MGVAGIALLPALGDLPGFLHSAVMVQVREVLRMDSLSLAVPWRRADRRADARRRVRRRWCWRGGPGGRGGPRRRRRASTAALAVTLFTAFAFGKKAFCNYYVMVLAVLVLAIAVRRNDREILISDRRSSERSAI